MQLHYLLFDASDEASGYGSFDAMASVAPGRLPALLAEISTVLRWAHARFGPVGEAGEEADWDFDLQAVAEPGIALPARYDTAHASVVLAPMPSAARTTITLTLSGSPAFCAALREAFALDD
jgi:hypothetical protein